MYSDEKLLKELVALINSDYFTIKPSYEYNYLENEELEFVLGYYLRRVSSKGRCVAPVLLLGAEEPSNWNVFLLDNKLSAHVGYTTLKVSVDELQKLINKLHEFLNQNDSLANDIYETSQELTLDDTNIFKGPTGDSLDKKNIMRRQGLYTVDNLQKF